TAAFYYAGALCAIFGMEMLISFGASFLKKFITRRFLIWVDRTVGALFIGFSVVLIFPVVKTLFR
ncbi:MAG TPA: hypothetical protein VFU15_03450, partial [Bacteroidia bacterium]|nr:hypothetical protein [Bacteroidia bacterium]